jgi:acyl dehydratase
MRFHEIAEGAAPPPRTMGPLTRTDFVRYQGASGDMNPIHHDETFARAAGYEAPLAVGMLPAGALCAFAASWLGPENVRRAKVRWEEQCWPGDVLTFEAKVVKKYVEASQQKVDVELRCARQTGGTAVRGWMTFVFPE